MIEETFDSFKSRKLAEGYNEVLTREWETGFENAPREHPFDTDAIVAQGEYWLTLAGQTTHYRAGDAFQVARGTTHSERYGPEGAIFWAARKN